MRPGRALRRVALLSGLTAALPALGATGAAPPGASSCSGCHALREATGSSLPGIRGRPVGEIVGALAAFRTGARPATVMNRIATGFTEAESRAIAEWLAGPAP